MDDGIREFGGLIRRKWTIPTQIGYWLNLISFARLEPNGLSGRNGDLVACPWISTDATFAGFDYKDPKTSKFYSLAFLHGLLESAENRVDGNLGFYLGDAHLVGDPTDDILFNHRLVFSP